MQCDLLAPAAAHAFLVCDDGLETKRNTLYTMAAAEIDQELGQLGDMPLYDTESKYFLADFHENNTLPYLNAKATNRTHA